MTGDKERPPDSNQWLWDQREALAYRVSLFLLPIIASFSLFRLITGPLYMGAAGFAVVGALLKDLASYKQTGRFWMPPGALILVLTVGECVSFKAAGVGGIFWVYPTILVAFWTLEHNTAARAIALSTLLWTASLGMLMPLDITARAICTILPTIVLASMVARHVDAQKDELNRLLCVDPLTGALNRRRLNEILEDRLVTLRRYNRPASIILLDIDHFKTINDDFGHETGDRVLLSLSTTVRQRVRRCDHFFRYGGEEFIILLPETTIDGAMVLAEDLRQRISGAELLANRRVTVSMGVSQARADDELEQWLKRCDTALYQAKNGGRDQVRSGDIESTRGTR